MQNLVINGIEVRQNKDGLFSLNDLHKAEGAESSKAVWRFTRSKEFKQEVKYLELTGLKQHQIWCMNKNKHLDESGTWACKNLVYSYAMWVSVEFKFNVITAFDNLVNGRIIEAIELAKDSSRIRQVKTELDKLIDSELESGLEATHKLSNIINIYEKHSSSAGMSLASCRGVKAKISEAEQAIINRNQIGMVL